jgi:2-polyprenyl-3-methyl-5-hydroxy-6-metoxy-1,4-benzoquinol methylase
MQLLKNVVCPCQQRQYKLLFSINSQQKVIKCQACQLVRIWPALNEKVSEVDGYKAIIAYYEQKTLYEIYAREVLNLVQQEKQRGKLLDVGCSTGIFLSLAHQQGFEVIGIDVSEVVVRFVREKLKLNVLATDLLKAGFKENMFDVIVFNHVLEHISLLYEVIGKAYSLLKPQGILQLGVPNFDSLPSKIRRKRWVNLRPLQHIWCFTPDVLSRLLEKAGFKIKRIVINSPYRQYPRGIKGTLLSFFLKPFYSFSEKIGQGENLLLTAIKE